MIEFFKTQHLVESMVSERIVPGVNYAFIKKSKYLPQQLALLV